MTFILLIDPMSENTVSKQQFHRSLVAHLLKSGITDAKEIARATDIPVSTVYRHINNYQENSTLERKKGSGRPKSVTNEMHQYMGRLIQRNRLITSEEIASKLMENHSGISISDRTVRRYLQALNYQAKVPRTVPLMKDYHKQNRLN